MVEQLHQPRTCDQIIRQARPVQLGLQKDFINIRHADFIRNSIKVDLSSSTYQPPLIEMDVKFPFFLLARLYLSSQIQSA